MNTQTTNNEFEMDSLTEDQIKYLQSKIEEAIVVHRDMDLLRGSMKIIKKDAVDELSIPVKRFNQLVRMRMQGTRDEVEEENEGTMNLYDQMYGSRTHN